ncbi:ABC transporter substrate-binding protein [Lentzea flaviverrucosa]|uniref:ABC-type glycerol-3-phosphate transport system, substrate-binding protein n=1 Tax=Lentzea flaviverrucosa TaxID=200379 RepID=A0A1H9XE18_9PSEU|nr:extracellular solute-binding protein [Lentzea flaviverrucosa]RDI21534.1 ABC-type glycerol-3-phosphate transport system substrate-binding protein [Lentzea flaviverrucosa]SES44364.1 ABC-type glycerol-3-phosphate transport system, substrate-binding protein [Lentzea flaviverrucosa]
MKSHRARVAALVLPLALTACGSTPEEVTADGEVVLTVAMDAGLEPKAVEAFNARVAQFEQTNPDIDVKPQEYTWTAATFTAQLAGGTVPDVLTVPFTDGRGLIERGQIADVSGQVAALLYASSLNPAVAKAGQAADGKQWAVPIAAYGQALHYNRTLFTQAGLDPDKPPTTWAAVRTAAKQITERTGQAGYAQMTQGNTGGWILTTLDYAFGGRTEKVDGEKAEATIDTPEMAEVLGALRAMRWDDNSMGANFLYDWAGINQDFAAGRIGMYVSGGGNYGNLLTQNGLEPADYGVAALPLADKPDAGVLGGGTLAVVSPNTGDRGKSAAVKWIDFYYMGKLTAQDAAVADAKTLSETKQPVGVPALPVVDRATYDKQQEWVKQYVNVPLGQMKPYTDAMFGQPLVTEPTKSTQEVYKILDTTVQKLLTDRGADIASLLEAADAEAQSTIGRG